IAYETTAGNTYARQISSDLAATPVGPVGTGNAVNVNQILRWELSCDGTDTEVRVYAGQSITSPRIMTWTGWAPTGPVSWTGYRYRRCNTNRWNDQGPEVASVQYALYDQRDVVGQSSADRDSGNPTYQGVVDCQPEYEIAQ